MDVRVVFQRHHGLFNPGETVSVSPGDARRLVDSDIATIHPDDVPAPDEPAVPDLTLAHSVPAEPPAAPAAGFEPPPAG